MKLRLVFDTNVYITAALQPDRYADRWLRQAGIKFDLFTSEDILAEIEKKLDQTLGMAKPEIAAFLTDVRKRVRTWFKRNEASTRFQTTPTTIGFWNAR